MVSSLVSVLLVLVLVAIATMPWVAFRILRRDRVRASLSVVQNAQRTCATCTHFDLEAGQEMLRRNPVFANLVAPFLAPSEYHDLVTEVRANEEGLLENAAEQKTKNVPVTCNWRAFGMCLKHNEGIWQQTTAANRLKNIPDFTKDGDCYEERV